MPNQFEDKFEELKDALFEGITFGNMDIVFPRLEKLKEFADQSGVWEYRVNSREILMKIAYETDKLERCMAELIWLVGQWEMNKEEENLEDAMSTLEFLIEYLPSFPNVARQDIYAAIETLKKWFATTNREPHRLDWALLKTYRKLEEPELANQYLESLLEREKTTPFAFKNSGSCESCNRSRKIHYYASIGLLDKGIQAAQPFFEADIDYCMTSPRTGLAYLLDALLDGGRKAEIEQLIYPLILHMDSPFKAPVRIILPILRYYIEVGEKEKAQDLVDEYAPSVNDISDRFVIQRFWKLVEIGGLDIEIES